MKTITAFIISIFLFVNAFSQTTTPKPSQIHYNIHEKNPAAAFILSAFIPGTGQMYNEEVGKGLGLFFGTSACFTASVLLSKSNSEYRDKAYILSVVGIGLYLYSMIDAPIVSKEINSRNIDSFGFNSRKQSLNVVILASNYPISIQYHF